MALVCVACLEGRESLVRPGGVPEVLEAEVVVDGQSLCRGHAMLWRRFVNQITGGRYASLETFLRWAREPN